MDYRVQVYWQSQADGRAADLLAQIAQLAIDNAQVYISNLYFLRGEILPAEIERLAAELLVDPVVEGYRWQPVDAPALSRQTDLAIEVGYHPGVTDPVARHLLRRAQLLGIGSIQAVTTGMRYVFEGQLSANSLHTIAREILCNDVIQFYTLGAMQPAFVPHAEPSDAVELVPLRQVESDDELARLSVERVLFLSIEEMQAIRNEFRRLGRDPTDVELETLAQTWSEHCQHKTFKAKIEYTCHGGMPRCQPAPTSILQPPMTETIDGLLRTYIKAATDQLARPWVISAFVDNAGIIDFDGAHEVSFKVETHNHPSALEPFGGANTGVGGVIRDVIGVSARPIANTDVLCFGPLDLPKAELPGGSLHPRRIARGVIAGIEDYGNKMGIPTVSGAILYDAGYAANPLVYCGCVGMARKGQHQCQPRPGDLCVALGGRTGRDGLHGATFSSAELTHETGQTVGSVVQIGDPITEKATLEAVIRARDEGLYHAITDCGAGGFSSAAGEMGQEVGIKVQLRDAPLKYPGLRPWEVWLSEAQERMVLAVPPGKLARVGQICDELDVEWTVIGRFTGDGRLCVNYGDRTVADLDMRFVHHGWPKLTLRAEWKPPALQEPVIAPQNDYTPVLLRMLAHPDVASKEAVIRRYDHEVQGATIVKPLAGAANDGPSDAAVLRPSETQGWQGLALSCGICPHYGQIDPYAMAWAAVDEAVRNVVCVGANPDRVALLDNFCWGNPKLPDHLGGLVRAAQGCYDAAMAYGTPFISGKDSLNNEYLDARGAKRTIPPTLLISSLGIVPDVRHAVTMDLKCAGNYVYLVGETRNELGGSLYHRLYGAPGNTVPAPVPGAIQTMRALHQAMQAGLVRACHDLSEGGLAVAAAEMCIAGRLGLNLNPNLNLDLPSLLFAETSGRFLVELAPGGAAAFEKLMHSQPYAQVGTVTADSILQIHSPQDSIIISCSLADLCQAWQSTTVV